MSYQPYERNYMPMLLTRGSIVWVVPSERQVIEMSKTKFCDKCGAPIPSGNTFCDRCGEFIGIDDDDSVTGTERMPQAQGQTYSPTQGQNHGQVQAPVPVTQVATGSHSQTKRQDEPKKGDGHDSEVLGWVFAVVFAILVAGLVGYIVGTSGNPKDGGTSSSDKSEQVDDWQYGTYGTDDDKDEKNTGKDADTDKDDKADKKDAEKDSESDKGDGDSDKQDKSSDDGMTDDKKDDKTSKKDTEEPAETKRLRESVSKEMGLSLDGRLNLGLSVPDDGTGVSERVEVIQSGHIIYSSRIVAPGETLSWVPSEKASVGTAKAVVYGIKGDRDYGDPVTVTVEIVRTDSTDVPDDEN